MDIIIKNPKLLDLQLFAEGASGGDGGTGAEGTTGESVTAAGSQKKGAKSNPLANVVYGIQPTETTASGVESSAAKVTETATAEDRNAKFEELIKGEYKDLYDARMQDTIQKRLKGTKETVDRYNALSPTLEMLGKKYGVDANDIEALNRAIEEDDSYYEEEALEKGLSVQQLKEIRKMERENAELKRINDERERKENADKVVASWMNQANEVKNIYPSFDFRAEMQNPQFVQLLNSHVDVRTAYEVIHKDDIISGAMQFAVKTAEQKLTNKIIANGARPSENGNSSQSGAIAKSDVSKLTKADRAEVIRRVANGDIISFG